MYSRFVVSHGRVLDRKLKRSYPILAYGQRTVLCFQYVLHGEHIIYKDEKGEAHILFHK